MSLHIHRSHRVESLGRSLARVLEANWPHDPFTSVPVVVGSRGMERWLRHLLAQELGAVSGIDFPFPEPAFAGASLVLIEGDARSVELDTPFWQSADPRRERLRRWSGSPFALRVLLLIREALQTDDFTAVRTFLGAGHSGALSSSSPVSRRELGLCAEVAEVLNRLMHHRPADATKWAEDPDKAEAEYRWLAVLLNRLSGLMGDSPAKIHEILKSTGFKSSPRILCIFGLSTLGPGERERIEILARAMEVHFFLLVPSSQWWADIHSKFEQRRHLQRASDPEEFARLEADYRHQNAMLASFGIPSRELQNWLEELSPIEEDLDHETPAPTSFLHHLQRWIDTAEGMPTLENPLEYDLSVSFHATHGALRQCEVLRTLLLSLFERHPTLEPRDVLVMTPDIATYAPILSAVFARSEGNVPYLPTCIADLGFRQTNPIAEVLVRILEFSETRVSANALLGFLALAPIRGHFELTDTDLADLRELVAASNLRWAWDADDRAHHGQPKSDLNTVRFALERMALGIAMPELGGADVLEGPHGLPPAVPLPVRTRDRAARFGKFARICRTLEAAIADLRMSLTMAEWRERFSLLLTHFCGESTARAEVESRLAEVLSELPEVGLEVSLKLEVGAVAGLISSSFEEGGHGDRPVTGAVTVCALEPMRSVPFKVIALLGMDHGVFPRTSRRSSWDPLSERRSGELDRREVDRHLILEALLSAREHFLCLYTGYEPKRGEIQPASIVIEELIDVVARTTHKRREDLITHHTLQPWSPPNFEASSAPAESRLAPEFRAYDAAMAEAAAKVGRLSGARLEGLRSSTDAPLPGHDPVPSMLRADELARALAEPQRHLLKDRLGLLLDPRETEVRDREPLELDELEQWDIRRRLLEEFQNLQAEAELDDSNFERLPKKTAGRLQGEGRLPPGAAGEALVTGPAVQVRRLWQSFLDGGGTLRRGSLCTWRSPCGLEVSGRAPYLRIDAGTARLEWVFPSMKLKAKYKLEAWVQLLLAVVSRGERDADGHPLTLEGARLSCVTPDSKPKGDADTQWQVKAPSPEVAQAILIDLVSLFRLIRERPTRLMGELSFELVTKLGRDAWVRRDALKILESDKAKDALDDVWVSALFEETDVEGLLDETHPSSLEVLSKRLWGPILFPEKS